MTTQTSQLETLAATLFVKLEAAWPKGTPPKDFPFRVYGFTNDLFASFKPDDLNKLNEVLDKIARFAKWPSWLQRIMVRRYIRKHFKEYPSIVKMLESLFFETARPLNREAFTQLLGEAIITVPEPEDT